MKPLKKPFVHPQNSEGGWPVTVTMVFTSEEDQKQFLHQWARGGRIELNVDVSKREIPK